jgi:hypothetical protein
LPAWFAKVWWISSSRASIVACGIQVSAQSNVVHVAQKVALSDVASTIGLFRLEIRTFAKLRFGQISKLKIDPSKFLARLENVAPHHSGCLCHFNSSKCWTSRKFAKSAQSFQNRVRRR